MEKNIGYLFCRSSQYIKNIKVETGYNDMGLC
jgi:hypothetical protein